MIACFDKEIQSFTFIVLIFFVLFLPLSLGLIFNILFLLPPIYFSSQVLLSFSHLRWNRMAGGLRLGVSLLPG